MDQKTGIGSLYDEFFRGYGAEIRLFCPDFRPNSTYKPIFYDQEVAVKMPRFRIAWVMVAVAALDFGAIRAVFGFQTDMFSMLCALPVAT